MSMFNFFSSKKQETLKTDELRRKAHEEISSTKGDIDDKFTQLTRLVDEAFAELVERRRIDHQRSHPKKITR